MKIRRRWSQDQGAADPEGWALAEMSALLVRRDAHLVMDLCLVVIDEVEGIHIHGDGQREQVQALDERRSLQIAKRSVRNLDHFSIT